MQGVVGGDQMGLKISTTAYSIGYADVSNGRSHGCVEAYTQNKDGNYLISSAVRSDSSSGNAALESGCVCKHCSMEALALYRDGEYMCGVVRLDTPTQ